MVQGSELLTVLNYLTHEIHAAGGANLYPMWALQITDKNHLHITPQTPHDHDGVIEARHLRADTVPMFNGYTAELRDPSPNGTLADRKG